MLIRSHFVEERLKSVCTSDVVEDGEVNSSEVNSSEVRLRVPQQCTRLGSPSLHRISR